MSLKNLGTLAGSMQQQIDVLPFKDILLPEAFKQKYSEFVNSNTPGGYQKIEWDRYTAHISTKNNKSIYLPNYWFYSASKLAHLIGALKDHRQIFLEIFSKPSDDRNEIATTLRSGGNSIEAYKKRIDDFFSASNYNQKEKEYFLQFVTDYAVWGGGKSIDRGDYFVSPIMSAGNLLAETQSAVAEIALQLSQNQNLWSLLDDKVVEVNLAEKSKSTISKTNPSTNFLEIPKPFILLAGISGTGKSRFIRKQAEQSNADGSNFCLIPVRPDWHEPSDLLGYVSRINGEQYVASPFLKFIVKAWIEACGSATNDEITLKPLENIAAYWACLDEMNLAPVEQYFVDYLAVLETREWTDDGKYKCNALVHPAQLLEEDDLTGLQKVLGLEDHDGLWDHFKTHGIPVPPNLIVAGTVNMDETTHGFSRKVIDRAFTIDFGAFFPNEFDEIFEPQSQPNSLTFSRYSQANRDDLANVAADTDGKKSIAFLKEVNDTLKTTPFELAYRALNELLLAVKCFAPKDDVELSAVWDDFLMTKLLPRIEGDSEKLNFDGTNSLLTKLQSKVGEKLNLTGQRPDLLRTSITGGVIDIEVRSIQKLQWMQDRLVKNNFTSFWP